MSFYLPDAQPRGQSGVKRAIATFTALTTAIASSVTFSGVWGTSGIAPAQAQANIPVSVNPDRAVTFSCSESEAAIARKNPVRVAFGQSRIYIGYQQVTSDNQNPIVVRFDSGRRTWCRTDYEVSGDDGRGYGLAWNGGSVLYAVFSATGTQGTASQDYRRFTSRGWLPSYGSGGGPKVAVIARLNPVNGTPYAGTFVTARLSNGRTNSLVVTNLRWTGTSLVVNANSWFSPRRRDRQPMNCTGSSPFRYRIVFTPNLQLVNSATAERCF